VALRKVSPSVYVPKWRLRVPGAPFLASFARSGDFRSVSNPTENSVQEARIHQTAHVTLQKVPHARNSLHRAASNLRS